MTTGSWQFTLLLHSHVVLLQSYALHSSSSPFSLAVVHELTANAAINSLHIAPDATHILLGLKDGKMVVFSLSR